MVAAVSVVGVGDVVSVAVVVSTVVTGGAKHTLKCQMLLVASRCRNPTFPNGACETILEKHCDKGIDAAACEQRVLK